MPGMGSSEGVGYTCKVVDYFHDSCAIDASVGMSCQDGGGVLSDWSLSRLTGFAAR